MNKKVFQIMSAIVAFALTFGSFTNAGAAPQMAATTYYVSTTGNDANAGTSAAPFKTIQKCANAVPSGSVCSVAAGTYAERVNVTQSGIVFQGNGTVTMQGFSITGNNNVASGFYVLNATNSEGGIVIKGTGNTVKNNKVNGATLVGIQIQGSTHLVEGNEVWGTLERGTGDGDGIRFFGNGHIIRGNYIHDLTYQTNDVAHRDCFQTWVDSSKGTASNILIEGNTCDNRQYITSALKGQGIMMDGSSVVSNITIRNNIFRDYQTYILNVVGLKIENNVFDIYTNGAGLNLQNNTSATLKNNIFYNNSTVTPIGVSALNTGAALVGGGNWYYRTDGKYTRTDVVKFSTDKQGINPMFANPASADFHLQASSPACTGGENNTYAGAFSCGAVVSTVAPTLAATNTPITTASVTPSSTPVIPTNTLAATATNIPSATLVLASPTPTASLMPASPTIIPVQPSVTPTASQVPVQPTSTSVQPSATPIAATPTASAIPVLPTSTSVQPIATIQQQSQPTSETIYDDKHSSFVYSSDWRDVVLSKASGGSFKKTGEDGSTVTFTFTGQSFSVIYAVGPKFGKVNVYIDGTLVKTINENERTSGYQKRWNYPGQLTLSKHTLKLVVETPNGSIDAVAVR